MPSLYEGASASAKKKKPGILSRVMDVLSRPQYASAEAVRRATGKGKGSVFGGITAGLSGKKKTSYSTVLKEHGVKGPVGAIAGFVGDVALDPTTYIPGGVLAKGAAKGAKGVKGAGKTVASTRVAQKIGQTEGAQNIKKGAQVLGDEVGRTFRTGHNLPDEIHQLQLKHGGVGGRRYTEELAEIRENLRGVSLKDRKKIHEALANGTEHGLDEPLREKALWAKSQLASPRRKKIPEKVIWGDKKQDIATVIARHKYAKNSTEIRKKFLKEVQEKFPEVWADPKIQKELVLVKKTFSNDPDITNYWTKQFDKIQSIWKTQATVLNPGHHVRNLMGDSYLNFLDGVRTRAYYDAGKVVFDTVKDATIKVGKHKLDKAQIRTLYEEQGLKSGYVQSENLLKGATRFNRASKVMEKIGTGTDKREDFMRYAHFIDALRKEGKRGLSIEKAAERAALRVRKYNFDYADLTAREKKYFKRVVPFYTFTRKALPLQLEMLFTKPEKIARVSKGQKALERLTGTRTDDEDPFPGLDHALPPWYKDAAIAHVGKNMIVHPSLPVDLLAEAGEGGPGGAGREVLGRISPLLKTPVELSMGRDLEYGFKQQPAKYLARQLTGTRLAHQQITGDKKSEKELRLPGGRRIDERQLNWLTGLGIHRVGAPPSRKKKGGGKGLYG